MKQRKIIDKVVLVDIPKSIVKNPKNATANNITKPELFLIEYLESNIATKIAPNPGAALSRPRVVGPVSNISLA